MIEENANRIKEIIEQRKFKKIDNMTLEELAEKYLDIYLECLNCELDTPENITENQRKILDAPEEYFEYFFSKYQIDRKELNHFKRLIADQMESKYQERNMNEVQGHENLMKLAKVFLREYATHYDLDMNNATDAEELVKAIGTLEAQECESFFKENNIELIWYPKFKEAVAAEMVSFLRNNEMEQTETIKEPSQTEKNIKIQAMTEQLIETLNFKNLTNKQQNELLSVMENTSLQGIQLWVSQAIKETLNEKESKEVQGYLIEEMKKINNINQEDSAPSKNAEQKELPTIIPNNKMVLYKKMILAFKKLDYDHLAKDEKEKLIENIKNHRALTKNDLNDLNVTDEEYQLIRTAILDKLVEINYSKNTNVDELIEEYIKALQTADHTLFETLQEKLTISEIRKENPKYAGLSDHELETAIKKISERAKEITIEKILELDEVKDLVNVFTEKCKNASKKGLKKLEQYLNEFKNSKEMLGLTDFNKTLLVEELNNRLQKYQDALGTTPEIESLINSWKEMLETLSLAELLDFYKGVPNCKKDYLACEKLNDVEFEQVKEAVIDIIINELAKRIIQTLNLEETEDLEDLINEIKDWDEEDFKEFKIPKELQDSVKEKMIAQIKSKKESEKEEENEWLEIGTIVNIKEESPIYDEENTFGIDISTRKETLKAGKKGKIKGYVVKKENETKVITEKSKLKQALKEGYEVIGYDFEYRNYFKKQHSYVKTDNVIPKKRNIFQRHWKIITTAVAAFAVLIGGESLFSNLNNNDNIEKMKPETEDVMPEEPTPDMPEESTPDMPEESISEILKTTPDINVIFTTPQEKDNEAIIYSNIYDIGTDKAQTAYYKSDSEKKVDGLVLESPDGMRRVYTDTNEIIDLLENKGYKYIGSRTVNEHSYDENGNIKAYEGFFGAENIYLKDEEATLSRTLTK